VLEFPEGFVWGTATAAHQVEGGNWNNDWWVFEHAPGTPCAEPSGDACDQYHRYAEDIALLAELGLHSYRFSVEWSRVEPEDDEWSNASLDHYADVVATCHEHGVIPTVTLHHFTTPRWVAADGGWTDPRTPQRFGRFCRVVAERLGDEVGTFWTINEPNIVSVMGYLEGAFPPGERDPDRRRLASATLIDGHHRAVEAVRGAAPHADVGMTMAIHEWAAVDGGEERLAELREEWEDVFLRATSEDDLIGVQTYTRMVVGPDGIRPVPDDARRTLMGWEFRPEALGASVRRAAELTGLPVVVTENGVATDDDRDRIEYVDGALRALHGAIADGVDVRGYTYWTLLDNFEWYQGYGPTFGLVAVDLETFERSVKPSARWLGEVARANALRDA
jgi:beta-glucosidase